MSKKFLAGMTVALAMLLTPAVAMAHVIVTPEKVGIGEELVFNVSVPNEQQAAMTELKVSIPDGVTDVMPTTQDGWTIQTTMTGSGADARVTAITWSGGSIPVGRRQDFSFGAQAPGKAAQLDWKAYQTYADGTVVHWDQKPAGSDDSTGNAGPYSVTQVVNDLNPAPIAASGGADDVLPLAISIVAVIISVGGLLLRKRR